MNSRLSTPPRGDFGYLARDFACRSLPLCFSSSSWVTTHGTCARPSHDPPPRYALATPFLPRKQHLTGLGATPQGVTQTCTPLRSRGEASSLLELGGRPTLSLGYASHDPPLGGDLPLAPKGAAFGLRRYSAREARDHPLHIRGSSDTLQSNGNLRGVPPRRQIHAGL